MDILPINLIKYSSTVVNYLADKIVSYQDAIRYLVSDQDDFQFALDYMSPAYIYAIGYYLYLAGRVDAALQVFQNLASAIPEEAFYWRAVGTSRQNLRDYNGALTAFERAIALEPHEISSYLYAAETLLMNRDIHRGLEMLQRGLDAATGIPEANRSPEYTRAQFLLSRYNG